MEDAPELHMIVPASWAIPEPPLVTGKGKEREFSACQVLLLKNDTYITTKGDFISRRTKLGASEDTLEEARRKKDVISWTKLEEEIWRLPWVKRDYHLIGRINSGGFGQLW
ncbi:hypothetical protein KSP39_PZI004077 [Platanthera zijinensis]|uniref:Uncharacterized protein n=1 Tax=Platanthera zijinensis TaxID=2320716 RepID=A0AAP0BWJ9_9ASPA